MESISAFIFLIITIASIHFKEFFFDNSNVYLYNYLTNYYEDMEERKTKVRTIVGVTSLLLIIFFLLRGGCSSGSEDSQKNRQPLVNYEKIEEFIMPDVDTSSLQFPDITLYYISKVYSDKDFNKYNDVFVKTIEYKLIQYVEYMATRHTQIVDSVWNNVNTKENYQRFNNNNNYKKYVMDGLVK